MTLYFKNPGVMDLRAATTFGVNVKADLDAIGTFGTGFKYATGIILRLGGKLTLWRGLEKYEFFATETEIRGKQFNMVHVRDPDGETSAVGMTTEVGKNWKPWMAYREIRCNCTDEGGEFSSLEMLPEEGHTLIVVECQDLDLAHQEQDDYFVSGKPVCVMEQAEAYRLRNLANPEYGIFYKGVKVGEWGRPAAFRWNIKDALPLTEDRIVSSVYHPEYAVRRAICNSRDKEFIHAVLTTNLESFESHINYRDISTASEEFLDVAEQIVKQKPLCYNITLRSMLSKMRNLDPFEWVDPGVVEAKMLAKAERVCQELGFNTADKNIRVVDNLGIGVLGQVHNGNIYLSRTVFGMGTKMVAGTLYEELVHLVYGHEDETRSMQNHLIDRIMSLVEERTGEPL